MKGDEFIKIQVPASQINFLHIWHLSLYRCNKNISVDNLLHQCNKFKKKIFLYIANRTNPQSHSVWEQRKLGELCEIKTGPFGSLLHAEDYVDEGTPIVTTEHFKLGSLPEDKREIPQVSEEDAKRLGQYRAKEGDILFSRVGSVDINAQVFAGQNGWLFSGRVLRARPNARVISSAYLHYELETEKVKNSVTNRAVGGTMASINTEILSHTPIVVPKGTAEQRQIGHFFAQLDNLITLHQRELHPLTKGDQ